MRKAIETPPSGKGQSQINERPKPLKTSPRKWMGQINIDPMDIVIRLDSLPAEEVSRIQGEMSTFIKGTRKKTMKIEGLGLEIEDEDMEIEDLELFLTRAEVNGVLFILQQRASMQQALEEDITSKPKSEKTRLVDMVSSTILSQASKDGLIALRYAIESYLKNTMEPVELPRVLLSWEKWMLERLFSKLEKGIKGPPAKIKK